MFSKAFLLVVMLSTSLALVPTTVSVPKVAKNAAILTSKLDASRRLMFGSFLLPFAAPIAAVVPFAANASGGATAGGAYLLSAKQRYNERVVAGEKTQRSSIAYP